jgi:hypothetical protein
MSKALQSLSMLAAIGLALTGLPQSSQARGVAARSGSSSFSSQSSCWSPNGPTMTNSGCLVAIPWYVPLILDGSSNGWYTVTITATALNATGDVRCQVMSSDKNGITTFAPGFFDMLSSGAPSDRSFSVWVPDRGVAMLDCFVKPSSSVHTVNY